MTRNAFLSRLALLPALLPAVSPLAAAKIRSDWSRVQAVEAGQRTRVQLYEGEAPAEDLTVKGRFESATAESITLVLPDGQTRTFEKQAVRKVLVSRPFAKRWPGWASMVIAAVSLESARKYADIGLDFSFKNRLGDLVLVLPIGLAFFYGSRMGGIYNVPLKHRAKTLADNADNSQQAAEGGSP